MLSTICRPCKGLGGRVEWQWQALSLALPLRNLSGDLMATGLGGSNPWWWNDLVPVTGSIGCALSTLLWPWSSSGESFSLGICLYRSHDWWAMIRDRYDSQRGTNTFNFDDDYGCSSNLRAFAWWSLPSFLHLESDLLVYGGGRACFLSIDTPSPRDLASSWSKPIP